MYYYKKIRDGKVIGLRAISCVQVETDTLVKIDQVEFEVIKEQLENVPLTEEELYEAAIKVKEAEIIRQMAVVELEAEKL